MTQVNVTVALQVALDGDGGLDAFTAPFSATLTLVPDSELHKGVGSTVQLDSLSSAHLAGLTSDQMVALCDVQIKNVLFDVVDGVVPPSDPFFAPVEWQSHGVMVVTGDTQQEHSFTNNSVAPFDIDSLRALLPNHPLLAP